VRDEEDEGIVNERAPLSARHGNWGHDGSLSVTRRTACGEEAYFTVMEIVRVFLYH
jgi:hypothetical protein